MTFFKLILVMILFVLYGAALGAKAQEDKILLLSSGIDSRNKSDSIVGQYSEQVFEKSGIATNRWWLRWEEQIAFLKRNVRPACGYYYIKTPERESFLKFTLPIGHSRGYALVALKDHKEILAAKSLSEVIAAGYKGIYPHGSAYNKPLRSLVVDNLTPVSFSTERMTRMVFEEQYDFVIMARSFTDHIEGWAGFSEKLAMYSHLEEIKDGPAFHIACSKVVSDQMMDSLNKTIQEIGPVNWSK